MTDYTPEQIEEMRQAVEAADAAAAAEAAAQHEAHMAPLRTVTCGAAYAEVMNALAAIRPDYVDDADIFVHLNALVDIMPRLATVAGQPIATDTPQEAPSA